MPNDAALAAGEDATFLDLFGLLTRRWRTIARAVAGGVVVAVLLWVVMPSKYTSTTTFIPEVSSSLQVPSGLASLAGELGFGLGGGSTVSPRFFADVLTSQALENRTLLTRFHRPDGAPGDSATLLEILKVDGDNPLDSL